jgi:hypothetical protein
LIFSQLLEYIAKCKTNNQNLDTNTENFFYQRIQFVILCNVKQKL